jgi:putative ABC transport system permease protein
MRPSRLFLRLAVQHLGHRPVRTLLLALAVAVGGGAVFAASTLRQAIQHSMGVSLNRLGADLMVVPRETTVNLSAALLTVEPTPYTFDAATADDVARLPGVQVAAPQRYFALPTAGQGHGNEDLIVFDPQRESLGSPLHLFGRAFCVYGKLALTGVGPFERAYFVSFDTAMDLAAAARETTGRAVLDPAADRFSALLIQLGVGAAPEQFRFAAARLGGVQVVSGNCLSTTVRQGMTSVLDGAVLFTALMLLTTALMVGAMYTGLLAERRRELGLLLAVGMRPGQLVRLILAEAALTTALGGVCGVLLGAAGLVLFQRSLGYHFETMQVPFSLPGPAALAVTGLVSVLLCGGVGILGGLVPAWRSGRREPYDLVRGEGA